MNTVLFAPNKEVIFPDRKIPVNIKIAVNMAVKYRVFVNTWLDFPGSLWLLSMAYFVAPPIPSISPVPWIKL